jgi:hypothetical protein
VTVRDPLRRQRDAVAHRATETAADAAFAHDDAPAQRWIARESDYAHVLELPRVGLVEVLGKQPASIHERMPLAVFADDVPR